MLPPTTKEEEAIIPMSSNSRGAYMMKGGPRGGGGRRGPPALRMARASPVKQAFGTGRAKAKETQVFQEEGNDGAEQTPHDNDDDFDSQSVSSGNIEDYTLLPSLLEKKSSEIDPTAKLRPTIIKVRENWKKTYQKSILSNRETQNINASLAAEEKNKATDLLDALSKSGSISLDAVELHIVSHQLTVLMRHS